MPETGIAFDQIAPQTPRIININYLCVPLPSATDGDDVTMEILPQQHVIEYAD